MRFGIDPSFIYRPTVRLYGNPVPYTEEIKFLGVIFDQKLSFKPHVRRLKADCHKLINVMKPFSSNEWGADGHTLMNIYRALIRSKLDYGCVVYFSASESLLKEINGIAHQALRIATGAFKTTPIDSLYILANELLLSCRRKEITARYFCKLRCQLGNSAFSCAVPNYFGNTFQAKRLTPPFCIRARLVLSEIEISNLYIKPAFSYRLNSITTPC